MNAAYHIVADITTADTLPGAIHHDAAAYALLRERVFARIWQWIGELADVAEHGSLSPRELCRDY